MTGIQCHLEELTGPVSLLRLARAGDRPLPETRTILPCSTNEPRFPSQVPARLVVPLVCLGACVGLAGRAMRLRIDIQGNAEHITLLDANWREAVADAWPGNPQCCHLEHTSSESETIG